MVQEMRGGSEFGWTGVRETGLDQGGRRGRCGSAAGDKPGLRRRQCPRRARVGSWFIACWCGWGVG